MRRPQGDVVKFVIVLPEIESEFEDPVEYTDEDRSRARQLLSALDPEVERSFVAFAVQNLGCDFDDCEASADLIVVAVHSSVHKTKIAACCTHHSECLRHTIDQRKPGELEADEIDRMYDEMKRET